MSEKYSIGQRIAKIVSRHSQVDASIENGEVKMRGSLDLFSFLDEAFFSEPDKQSTKTSDDDQHTDDK